MKRALGPATVAVLVALAPAAPGARAEEWEGKVVGVADGDTVTVLRDRTPVRIRL